MISLRVAALALLLSASAAQSEEQPGADKTVITIMPSKRNFAYRVNAVLVKGDLLSAFSEAHQRAPALPVYLMVHEDAPLSVIQNTLGIMSKAELQNPRIFVYTKEKRAMTELTWGCPLIYSADLSQQTPMHGGLGCKVK